MTTANTATTADENHRAWLADMLDRAATDLSVSLVGEWVYGWKDRSIGSAVTREGETLWLRVVAEHHAWATGPFWAGNTDSNAITGINKPDVLDLVEYDEGAQRVRTELMTRLAGEPCSATQELHQAPALDADWWKDLRSALTTVAATPTDRVAVSQADITRRLRIFWGDTLDFTITEWATAHGDLHWANLHKPHLGILDWELWGTAPAGYDAATLYCTSLLIPDTAHQVHDTLGDLLHTPDGIRAQLYVTARLLLRADHGDFTELIGPLHQHASDLHSRVQSTP